MTIGKISSYRGSCRPGAQGTAFREGCCIGRVGLGVAGPIEFALLFIAMWCVFGTPDLKGCYRFGASSFFIVLLLPILVAFLGGVYLVSLGIVRHEKAFKDSGCGKRSEDSAPRWTARYSAWMRRRAGAGGFPHFPAVRSPNSRRRDLLTRIGADSTAPCPATHPAVATGDGLALAYRRGPAPRDISSRSSIPRSCTSPAAPQPDQQGARRAAPSPQSPGPAFHARL